MTILEACVETVEAARAAERGGASRIELCANLAEQGATPDDALLTTCVASLAIPVFAMVRPRPGPFVYDAAEIATMVHEVRRARALGASGIVTGALTPERAIDVNAMHALIEAAGSLPLTFHRAFDVVHDRDEALETLAALGAARVLTSGGAATAAEGAPEIARLVQQAGGRLAIVAGGGIRAHNVRDIVARTGVTEVHARLSAAADVRALAANLRAAAPR